MDRNTHPLYRIQCPRNIGLPNQYMWPQKDTNKYMCYNGISHPIYDCDGNVNYTLPLDQYPPEHGIHPQIAMVRRMHLNYRESPRYVCPVEQQQPRNFHGVPFRDTTEAVNDKYLPRNY